MGFLGSLHDLEKGQRLEAGHILVNLTLRNIKIEGVIFSVKGVANRKGEDLDKVYVCVISYWVRCEVIEKPHSLEVDFFFFFS